jgi:hypothetical protein
MKLNNTTTTTSTSTTIFQNDKEISSSSGSKLTNNQQNKESINQIKDQNQVTKDHREDDNDHDDTPFEVDYLRVISGK